MSTVKIIEPASLKLWLPFNGDVTDRSGNGLNGTAYNTPTYSDGKAGPALTLNGTNQYVTLGAVSTFSFIQNTGIFTISFWMKKTNLATTSYAAIFSTASSSTEKGVQINCCNRAAGDIECYAMKGTSGTAAFYGYTGAGAIPNTGWHYYVITCNNSYGSLNIYVDGVAQSLTKTFNGLSTGDATYIAAIGRSQYFSPFGYFGGSLDDVRIYNRVMNTGEVIKLYYGKRGQICG